MELFCLNNSFSFLMTEVGITYENIRNRIDEFKPVCIPHDWLISHIENLYLDSVGWYRCIIRKSDYTESDERFLCIYFDGVYMDSTVYLNGTPIKEWKYGYTPFEVSLKGLLKDGENELMVRVNHQSPNSRWYSGAGIYRNVFLRVTPKVHIPYDGIYVTMKEMGKDFEVNVSCEIMDESGKLISDSHLLKSGYEICHLLTDKNYQVMLTITGGLNSSLTVKNPKRWSPDSPNLYKLKTELIKEGITVDSTEMNIGFRTISFDPDEGMRINGKKERIKGVCQHHDLGCLGAAINITALKRQFSMLKSMGVNAIRTSHNPPAREFMDLADEMGFLVMDEAFDMWERPKTDYDYARFFKEYHEKDIRAFVRRDRNHPCLLMWSIGNEIYDTFADEHGVEITKELLRCVRIDDPKCNAPVTIGSNYIPWENAQKCSDVLKFSGYNYAERCYEEHHQKYKDWIIYGSETASVVSSRGVYHFPLSQSILSDDDEQCSSLGNSNTSWGAISAEQCIADNFDPKFCLGMFIWTGFDYIGEPTPYHTKNSYFGQIDTAGFAKDSFYIYKAKWVDPKTEPMVHLFPYWDFNIGQKIDVRVCSNEPFVELFVNKKSLGTRKLNRNKGTGFITSWEVMYEPGEIEAVAYDKNMNPVARDIHRSFKDSYRPVIELDKNEITPDGKDLVFATISTVDIDGNPVENAMDYVKIEVSGAGVLVGTDNGDSTDYDSYQSNIRKLFNGKLLAVIQSNGESGEINIDVTLLSAKRQQGDKNIRIPVRKIELSAPEGTLLNRKKDTAEVFVNIYPENADVDDISFDAVNDSGIIINNAKIERMPAPQSAVRKKGTGERKACESKKAMKIKVTALGDGGFRLRARDVSKSGKTYIISTLEFKTEGLGPAFINPYELVSGGLYTETVGEIGPGNEKGCSFQRDAISAVVFENIDFGPVGSDKVTLPVFTLSNGDFPFEIYEGHFGTDSKKLLLEGVYNKPSIWNVYQPETYVLNEVLKGINDISIVFHDKVHLKGFFFEKMQKAYSLMYASECDKIYGDSFRKEETAVTDIGNNVTIEFGGLDFGPKGTTKVEIVGRSPLDLNVIHLQFVYEDQRTERRILEISGNSEYEKKTYSIDRICGKCSLRMIFLPGSNYDLQSIRFVEEC